MIKYTISQFALLIKEILYSDRDAMVVFSGFSGEGKTTFSILLTKELCKILKQPFDMKKLIIIDQDDFLYKANNAKMYSVLIGDEAINIFFRREALTKDHIKAVRAMDTIRKKRLCLILNIPQFWSLDNHLIQGKVRFWGYIDKRRSCHLFKPVRHPFSTDVWNRRDNMKAVSDWEDLSKIDNITNYMGTLNFEKLSPQDQKQYNTVFRLKQEEQAKQIFRNIQEIRDFIRATEYIGINKLNNAKMLKHGAISWLAQAEGVGKSAISQRLDAISKGMDKYLSIYGRLFSESSKFKVSEV